jgi:hypothetical protein
MAEGMSGGPPPELLEQLTRLNADAQALKAVVGLLLAHSARGADADARRWLAGAAERIRAELAAVKGEAADTAGRAAAERLGAALYDVFDVAERLLEEVPPPAG